MTPEQAKDLLPIIKAYSKGKQIQIYCAGNWVSINNPSFVEDVLYRIKPDPIVVKYRRYLCKRTETRYYVDTCCSDEGVNHVEALTNFVRWIDTDWVTEVVKIGLSRQGDVSS